MKIVILILAIVVTIIGIKILDEIEGEDATILGMVCIVFGTFLGILAWMSFPQM